MERLIELPDHDLFAWATGERPIPPEFDTPVMRALCSHNRSGSDG